MLLQVFFVHIICCYYDVFLLISFLTLYFYSFKICQAITVIVCQVQFHPRNDRVFLVCPMRHAAVLVDTDGDHKVVPLDEEVSSYVVRSMLNIYLIELLNFCSSISVKSVIIIIFIMKQENMQNNFFCG